MPPIGRRSRLTDDITTGIADGIRAGNSLKAACARVGVNDGLARNWRKRGEAERDRQDAHPDSPPLTSEAPYRAFHAAVTQAMAEAEAGRVVRILEAGRPHEMSKTVRTTRNVVINRRDDQGRPYQEIQTVTDERVETWMEFDWRADAWWLEHARPQFWGRSKSDARATDEQAPDVEPDIDVQAEAILNELEERRRLRDGTAAG